MPIYNFKCQNGHEFETVVSLGTEEISCDYCKGIAKKQFTPTRFIPFRSYVTEDITGKPMEITSPRQLSKELHSRGLEISDRPIRHKQKRKGLRESTKKQIAEKLGEGFAAQY